MSDIIHETHPWLVVIDWPRDSYGDLVGQLAEYPPAEIIGKRIAIVDWLDREITDWLPGTTRGIMDSETETFRIKVKDETTATLVLMRWS